MTVAYLLLLIAFLDNFAMLPTIAPYAESLGARLTGVGVAVGAYSLTNLAFNIVGGVLLDRLGRRRLLVASLCLVSAAMLCYPLVTSLESLVAVRLLHGIGGGILVPAAFAVLGDRSPVRQRGRAMGRAGAVIGAAAVAGPALAGLLRHVGGFPAVFLAVALSAAAGALLAARGLPATRRDGGAAGGGPPLRVLLRRSQVRIACLSAFAFTGAVGSLAAFLPVHVEGLGHPASTTGAMFTLFALAAVAVMLSPLAALADGPRPTTPIALGLGGLALALALLAPGPALGWTAAAVTAFGIGFGLSFPAMATAIAGAAGSGGRGRAFGLFMAFYSLGFVLVPPLGGAAGDAWPALSPFTPAALLCAAGAGGLLLLADRSRPDRSTGAAPRDVGSRS